MRTEDWTKEEWEMTVQLERITAQNAEEKHQELSKRRKSERPRRTKKTGCAMPPILRRLPFYFTFW